MLEDADLMDGRRGGGVRRGCDGLPPWL